MATGKEQHNPHTLVFSHQKISLSLPLSRVRARVIIPTAFCSSDCMLMLYRFSQQQMDRPPTTRLLSAKSCDKRQYIVITVARAAATATTTRTQSPPQTFCSFHQLLVLDQLEHNKSNIHVHTLFQYRYRTTFTNSNSRGSHEPG